MLYLTPGRYRTMGMGADIDAVDDSELAMQLRLASSLVTRACNRPITYDFRGGLVVDERHTWRIGNGMAPGSYSVFPKHRPLIELDSFRIYVTNTQYLDVSNQYVNYNSSVNALSPVVAATSIGIWSYTAIPVAGFVEPEVRLTYTYGYRFPVSDDQMYPEGEGVYRAANQWWTDDEVVVYKNGAVLADTNYTINSDEGTIDLTQAAQDAMDFDDVLTVDYIHRLPEEIRDATAVVVTDLLGAANIVGAGLLGLSGIRAEEIELRQSTNSRLVEGQISDRAGALLTAYREIHWG